MHSFTSNYVQQQQHTVKISDHMQGLHTYIVYQTLWKTNLEIYVWISTHYHEDLWQLVLEQEAAVSNPEKQIKENYQSGQKQTN